MTRVFGILAALCSGLLVGAILLGASGSSNHLMWGLGSAIFAVSIHCLIFAIFTGSGKDTRLLVEDLGLNAEFVKKTKVFKRTVFPPALYAILFLLITTTLGGALSLKAGQSSGLWLGWLHGLWASFTVYYNLKVFRLEYRAVRENSQILAKVNSTAGELLNGVPAEPTEFSPGTEPQKVADLEWGTHVYALGKFMGFLGWNTWLVYLYFRVIMAEARTPLWPFITVSLLSLLSGYYLKFRYGAFRPTFSPS